MLKQINLKNKIALVTGAGKGIGKACAIALAQAGAKVIIVSRTKSDLDKVSKIIKKTKGSSQSFVCDVTNVREGVSAERAERAFLRGCVLYQALLCERSRFAPCRNHGR